MRLRRRRARAASGRHEYRWSRFTVGIVAIVIVAIATYFGFAKDIPFTNGYRIHAVFESSNNLRPGAFVRIAGVNVGRVKSISRYKDTDLADVEMEIQPDGLPIHEDATFKIRPRIFLEGNFFVDVHPGTPGSPVVPDGGTIGPTQTSRLVQVDEVLTALQADTRKDLQQTLHELGIAFNAKPTPEQDAELPPQVRGLTGGEALNAASTWAPDALRGTALVSSALLGTEPHDLSRMIAGVGRLARAVQGHERELQSLITDFNITAGAFAAQSENLSATIRELGPTLALAQTTLRNVDAALPATREFARDILPGVRETPATLAASFPWLRQMRAFVAPDELGGVLRQLQPAVADLARLTDGTLELLPQIDLADRCFIDVFLPTGNIGVRDGAHTTRRSDGSIVENYKEFWYAVAAQASEGQNFDANGAYIRASLGGGSHTVLMGRSRSENATVVANANYKPLGTSPLFPRTAPPYRPTVPCHTQPVPNVNGPLAGPGPAPESTITPTPPPVPIEPEEPAATSASVATSGADTDGDVDDLAARLDAEPLARNLPHLEDAP